MTSGEMTLMGVPASVYKPLLAALAERGVETRACGVGVLHQGFAVETVIDLLDEAAELRVPWDDRAGCGVLEAQIDKDALRALARSLYVAPPRPAPPCVEWVAVRECDKFAELVDDALYNLWRGGDLNVDEVCRCHKEALAALDALEVEADVRSNGQDIDLSDELRCTVAMNASVFENMLGRVHCWHRYG